MGSHQPMVVIVQDSKSWKHAFFLPVCFLLLLLLRVPWRALNSQACKGWGGWAEHAAWGLPRRANSIQ